jgi:acyl-CoA thioesterase FadM
VDEVSIGDTIGAATPQDVETTGGYLLQQLAGHRLAMHFHDTYGMAIANIYYLAVAEAICRYHAPARYDDEILVETEMTRLGSRILEFSYRIKTGDTLLAEGRTLHAVIGPGGKPRSMPQRYLEVLKSRLSDQVHGKSD